jgi:hypothetical protein
MAVVPAGGTVVKQAAGYVKTLHRLASPSHLLHADNSNRPRHRHKPGAFALRRFDAKQALRNPWKSTRLGV